MFLQMCTYSRRDSHTNIQPQDRVWRNPWEELVHVYHHGSWARKIYFFSEFFWVVVVWITGGWLRQRKWWMTLFFMMLGWIVLQCIYLTYWLEKTACTIGITPGAMGTILGAAGTSIPNLLCSMYVARKG
jgi:Ca2+/Na+ antiporter